MALMKLCPVCGRKISYADKYCIECTRTQVCRQANSNRHYDKIVRKSEGNKVYDSFYHSKLWLRVRGIAVARDYGLCKDCLRNNITTLYNTVHHVVPIKINFNKRLDTNNLICLCETCHKARHKELNRRG